MPSDTQHFHQTERSIKFLRSFYHKYEYNDWTITVSFYIAVHVIEGAIFKKKKFKINDKEIEVEGPEEVKQQFILHNISLPEREIGLHRARRLLIQYGFPEVDAQYKELYTMSRAARYTQFSWTNLEAGLVVGTYLKYILEWANNKFQTSFDTTFKQL